MNAIKVFIAVTRRLSSVLPPQSGLVNAWTHELSKRVFKILQGRNMSSVAWSLLP